MWGQRDFLAAFVLVLLVLEMCSVCGCTAGVALIPWVCGVVMLEVSCHSCIGCALDATAFVLHTADVLLGWSGLYSWQLVRLAVYWLLVKTLCLRLW